MRGVDKLINQIQIIKPINYESIFYHPEGSFIRGEC